ncbi:MAG TPA: choice-of-anchor R domain-containing protein [Verrucomicrobiae bacterium]|nr:choice-of-anchor R domain-containing protein [Verrucomicrobiae bacterium]
MKTNTLAYIFALATLASQTAYTQGTTYLSDLNAMTTGNVSIGSDSWAAEIFFTGNDPNGYLLNSVQLSMANASGNPSGFTVGLYSVVVRGFGVPGSSLESLSGTSNPANGGLYAYTPDSNLVLSPNTAYFLVLTSGTTVANGAYEWNLGGGNSIQSDHWNIGDNTGNTGYESSSDGSTWNFNFTDYPQFAINGTIAPEPSTNMLLGLSLICLLWCGSKRFTVKKEKARDEINL